MGGPIEVCGYAAKDVSGHLTPFKFSRRCVVRRMANLSFSPVSAKLTVLRLLQYLSSLVGGLDNFAEVFPLLCRPAGAQDVTFKILYCGICHSDLHQLRNEWQNSKYPMVPGYIPSPTPFKPMESPHHSFLSIKIVGYLLENLISTLIICWAGFSCFGLRLMLPLWLCTQARACWDSDRSRIGGVEVQGW
jgi:hypothetical protein